MLHDSQRCDLCLFHARHGRSPRCVTCRRLVRRRTNIRRSGSRPCRFSAQAAIEAIGASIELGRQLYGADTVTYVCHYTQVPLSTDPGCSGHGDYASFDHVIPRNQSRLVLCSRFINGFKGSRTDLEFRDHILRTAAKNQQRLIHNLSRFETQSLVDALKTIVEGDETRISDARSALKELLAAIRFKKEASIAPSADVTV